MKGTQVARTCGRALIVYALPGEVKDRQVMSLHQAARHGKSEMKNSRRVEEHQELRQGVRESKAVMSREIQSETERASVVHEADHLI